MRAACTACRHHTTLYHSMFFIICKEFLRNFPLEYVKFLANGASFCSIFLFFAKIYIILVFYANSPRYKLDLFSL